MSKRKKGRSKQQARYKARAKQQAQLERMDYATEVNGIAFEKLTSLAYRTLIARLIDFGTIVGEGQEMALYELVGRYTKIAQGLSQGRYAFPLSTGLGKTQSIVAWISALHELGLDHVSVAVCQSKVEALCDLKRDLIEAGVPSEKIGLLHTYKHDPERAGERGYASLPSTEENDTRPFLLCTHNRVMGKGGVEQFNTFNGSERNLLIWDESLMKSEGRSLTVLDIESAHGWFKPQVKERNHPLASEVIDYFSGLLDKFNEELEAQKADSSREAQPIHSPSLTVEKVQEFMEALGGSKTVGPLKQILDMSQRGELRVVYTGQQKAGIIQYDVVVPSCLKNIVILDASYPIRELMKLDSTIQKVAKASQGVVDYSQVTINQLRHNSGRESIREALEGGREKRLLCQEIVHAVKNEIPANEGVIFFSFKDRRYDLKVFSFEQVLKDSLEAAGVDLAEKLPCGRDRFVWLTWGNETSLSKFSYCSNVILVGVLHRSKVDLSASIAGQADNLLTDIDGTKLNRVLQGELAHSIYQAISRGRCRTLTGEYANPTKAWLIHRDKSIRARINEVMPGVNWETWEPLYVESKGKIEKGATQIVQYLSHLVQNRISSSALKRDSGLSDMPRQTFIESCNLALNELAGSWCRDKRSFVRI